MYLFSNQTGFSPLFARFICIRNAYLEYSSRKKGSFSRENPMAFSAKYPRKCLFPLSVLEKVEKVH